MTEIKRAFIVMLLALTTAVIISTPSNIYAADECDATISPEGLIHIPVVRYMEDLYTLDLQYLEPSGSGIDLSIEKVAATTQDCPAESEITSLSPFTLKISSLEVGSDNYDITLSEDSGQKTNAPQLPGFFNAPYGANGFNAETGRPAIYLGSDGKYHITPAIKTYTRNSDVWKGKSSCVRDITAIYGGTSYAMAKAYDVKFTKDTANSDEFETAYTVSEGSLYFAAEINRNGTRIVESGDSGMSSSAGTIKTGVLPSATGTGIVDIMSMPFSTGTATCSYSGIAYAEWLYIPSAVFLSSTKSNVEVLRTGKVIELNKLPGCVGSDACGTSANMRTWNCVSPHVSFPVPGVPDFATVSGDLTCTWSFKYYP